MNRRETVKLVAAVKALCPSQKFEEVTPDAWNIVLDDVHFDEALAAVKRIYREQGNDAQWVRVIEADDIIRQVKRDRSGRDRVKCYICGHTRAQCERLHDFELGQGLPDPHKFESSEEADHNTSRRQLDDRKEP